jgi:hypothetical protein
LLVTIFLAEETYKFFFRGWVEDLVNGPVGPVILATSSALLDLRPLSFGVYDPEDKENSC